MIENKISEIIEKEGKCIIVLKGFDESRLSSEEKYFSFNIEYLDKIELDIIEEQVTEEVINNRIFESSYKWMSIEEYQLFKKNSFINKMPIVLLENNLYDKQFPYSGKLSNIEEIYHYLYYQEDEELEPRKERTLEIVSYFYGRIDYSKVTDNYFITYPEFEEKIIQYKLHEEIPIDVDFSVKPEMDDLERIELSDDEIPFLDLESKILNNTFNKDILLVISQDVENLPNKYLERLNIIKKTVDINIFFSTLSIRRQVIENEKKYLKF